MNSKLPGRAVVLDRFCAEAVLRGADVFAGGILHMSDKVRVDDQVLVWADLGESEDYSKDESDAYVNSDRHRALGAWRPTRVASMKGWWLASRRRRLLGMGIVRQNRASVFVEAPKDVAVSMFWRKGASCAPPLDVILQRQELKSWNLYCPTLPSTVVAHLLRADSSETVLDCCAAPGGKTSHMAALLAPDAVIVACEISKRKAYGVRELVDRLGVGDKVIVVCCDSRSSVLADGDSRFGPAAIRAAIAGTTPGNVVEACALPPLSFDV